MYKLMVLLASCVVQCAAANTFADNSPQLSALIERQALSSFAVSPRPLQHQPRAEPDSFANNQAQIWQLGHDNQVDVVQLGQGNELMILQRGDDNLATIVQRGDNNFLQLEQRGQSTFSIEQIGNNGAVSVTQY